jgi:hypothetical protein
MSVDKTIKAWGGFCEGQLDFGGWPLGNGGILPVASVFRNRKEAHKRFQDVRRIEIKVVEVKRKKASP